MSAFEQFAVNIFCIVSSAVNIFCIVSSAPGLTLFSHWEVLLPRAIAPPLPPPFPLS